MIRSGVGFDAHAFSDDRPCVIGGVTIPGSPGLAGHSDGDVLSHAIADALLGATKAGDIGEVFPGDERWRDASSLEILREVRGSMEPWTIASVDATVIAEKPRLAPYRDAMVAAVASALTTDERVVSVKATTTDGLGFTGRGEGIAAIAVVVIERA